MRLVTVFPARLASSRGRWFALAAVLATPFVPGAAVAQVCDTTTSRTSLASLAGRPVRSVNVIAHGPPSLPGPARAADRLHVTTRQGTVRRHLLFEAGQPLDTLQVAESLRRLRQVRYLADVSIEAAQCDGDPAVDLTVITVDGWSVKADLRVRSGAPSALGLTERNLLGTGREATAAVRSDQGQVGVGLALRDPWLFGSAVSFEVGGYRYAHGQEWYARGGRREQSVFDRHGLALSAYRSQREPAAGAGQFQRTGAGFLATQRVDSGPTVVSLVGGAEFERAGLVAAPGAPLLGPRQVRRDLVLLDGGLTLRSAVWDTLTWLLSERAIVDVPLRLEADALVGLGYDRVTGRPAGRLDLWAGRMWLPGRHTLLVADAWASGTTTGSGLRAGTVRGSLAWFQAAPGGRWSTRLAAERLISPDPDIQALAAADPTRQALPAASRLAEGAVSLGTERAWRLRDLSRSWSLDGAVFGAWSWRDDPAGHPDAGVTATVIGVGLRLAPARSGRETVRFDVGYAVQRTPGVSPRPFFAISASPALDQFRRRDGRERR